MRYDDVKDIYRWNRQGTGKKAVKKKEWPAPRRVKGKKREVLEPLPPSTGSGLGDRG